MGKIAYKFEDYVTDKIVEEIPKWKRAGRTDVWIAKKIGIGLTKLKEWKKQFPHFEKLFDKGREDLLQDLEESMYNLALGKIVTEKSYAVNSQTGQVLDNIVNVKEKFVQSTDMLKHSLATIKPEKYGKLALEGKIEDKKDKLPVFGGEEDL